MSETIQYPGVLPASIPISTHQEPYSGFPRQALALYDSGNVTIIPSLQWATLGEQEREGAAIQMVMSQAIGDFEVSNENDSGFRWELNEGNVSVNVNVGDYGVGSGSKVVKARKTKTTTAALAKETDDKIVHLGLFVALLGVLSIVL